jgi:hypothetical protein
VIRRKKELARGGYIKRRKRVRPRNPARHATNQARAYEGPRATFVKTLPCLICAYVPSENAHLTNGGLGRKDDASRTVPLCGDFANGHHTEYDTGKKSFRKQYGDVELGGLTLEEHAARVEAFWQARKADFTAGLTRVSAIVPGVVAAMLEEGE